MVKSTPRTTKVTRRRRQFKSCLFCRKRKLKCDHVKPICKQCSKRGINKCIYSEDFNYDITAEELFEKFPNVQLVEEVTKLQTQIETNNPNFPRDPTKLQFIGQPYFSKNDKQLYGYSSVRCMTNFQSDFIQKMYMNTLEQINQEFQKQRKPYPVTIETSDLPQLLDDELVNVCKELPGYDIMKLCLVHFFNSSLFDLLGVIDEKKTLDTFSAYFIPNEKDEDDVSKATQIVIPSNGNIFQVAIIILIVAISPYTQSISPSLNRFLVIVANLSANYTGYVEFCQFLVLRCMCRSYDDKLDFSNDLVKKNLICKLCQGCLDLGLANVDVFYSELTYTTSELISMKKTFYWTLFLDVYTALQFGTQVYIQDGSIDGRTIFDADIAVCGTGVNKRRNGLLKEFLMIMRTMLNQFNQIKGMPHCNIVNHIGSIQKFIQTKLLPMKFYADFDSPVMMDPLDLVILGILIESLIVLNHSRKKYYHEINSEVDRDIIHYCNLLSNISFRSIIGGHAVDQFAYPGLFADLKGETPHLHLFLGITEEFLTRSIFHFYSLIFEGISNDNSITSNEGHLNLIGSHASVMKLQNLFNKVMEGNERKLLSRLKRADSFIYCFLLQTISFKFWVCVANGTYELHEGLGDACSNEETMANVISERHSKLLDNLSAWNKEDIVSKLISRFN